MCFGGIQLAKKNSGGVMNQEKLVASRESWHKEVSEKTAHSSRTVEIEVRENKVADFLEKLEASRQASRRSDGMVC